MRGLVLCVPLVGLLAPPEPGPGPGRTTVAQGVLPPHAPIRKQLKAGEVHEYVVPLAAGQAVKVAAAQIGIDVKLELADPGGTTLVDANDWVQVGGSEILAWVTQRDGDHRIKVWTENSSAEPGDYELQAEAAAATETHVAAITAYNEGRRIFERASRATENQRAQMTEALRAYERALEGWRALGDRRLEADMLYGIAFIHGQLEDPARALELGRQALDVYRTLGLRREEIRVLQMLAVRSSASAEYFKALEYYEQAEALAGFNSPTGAAVLTLNKGTLLGRLGEYERALEALGRALEVFRSQADRYREPNVLLFQVVARAETARVQQSVGNHDQALEHLLPALELAREIQHREREADILLQIGQLHSFGGDDQAAMGYFEQGLAARRALGNRRGGEGQALLLIADVQVRRGDLDAAQATLEQAAAAFRAGAGDKLRLAQVDMRMSEVHERRGERDRATSLLEGARAQLGAIGSRQDEIEALRRLARVQASAGDAKAAGASLEEALAISRSLLGRPGEAPILRALARQARERGDLDAARGLIESAIERIEADRSRLAAPSLRTTFSETLQEYYADDVETLMLLHQRAPGAGHHARALEASERGRARALVDLLSESRVDLRAGVDGALLAEERRLRDQIHAKDAAVQQLAAAPRTAKAAAELDRELGALTAAYRLVEARIRAASPRHAALTRPDPLAAADLQKLLDEDTVLIEFALGETRSWMWAATPVAIVAEPLPPRAEVEGAARAVYGALTARQALPGESAAARRRRLQAADRELREAGTRLGEILFGPLASRLAGEWEGKRLAIVPAGALEYVPLAVLPAPPAAGTARGPTLLDRHEVVQLPSASVLALLRQDRAGRPDAPASVAVLGDPVFTRDDPRVGRGKKAASPVPKAEQTAARSSLTRALDGFATPGLTRLPFSRQEVNAVATHASSSRLLKAVDFEASRATVVGGALADYRIVHFATHGLLNSARPELSALVLSLVDEGGRDQDGLLRLGEIYNLRLPADVVVLSACQTALGKEIRGEGLVGLTRGFMHAGAARVVASLWPVDDLATAELMTRFYRGMLKEGRPTAAALRAAQLEMSRSSQWHAPYYWAGFVLQGEWR
jgi:CHAT domain-containing protein